MSSPCLEKILLKNVLIYLHSMIDVLNFQMISKKCKNVTETVTINPYMLSKDCTFDIILKVFPCIQTYYINDSKWILKENEMKTIQNIIIDNWKSKEKHFSLLHSKWFVSKIEKMKIDIDTYSHVFSYINLFEKLRFVIIDVMIPIETTKKIMNVQTLEKCVIYLLECEKLDKLLSEFQFNKYENTLYTFVVYSNSFNKTIIDSKPNNVRLFVIGINNSVDSYHRFLSNTISPISLTDNGFERVPQMIESANNQAIIDWKGLITLHLIEVDIQNSIIHMDCLEELKIIGCANSMIFKSGKRKKRMISTTQALQTLFIRNYLTEIINDKKKQCIKFRYETLQNGKIFDLHYYKLISYTKNEQLILDGIEGIEELDLTKVQEKEIRLKKCNLKKLIINDTKELISLIKCTISYVQLETVTSLEIVKCVIGQVESVSIKKQTDELICDGNNYDTY
ncbi:LRR containing protein [Entamoeba marina]